MPNRPKSARHLRSLIQLLRPASSERTSRRAQAERPEEGRDGAGHLEMVCLAAEFVLNSCFSDSLQL